MQTATALAFVNPGAIAQGVGAAEVPTVQDEMFLLDVELMPEIGPERAPPVVTRRLEHAAMDAAYLSLFPASTLVPAPQTLVPTVGGGGPEQVVAAQSGIAPAHISIDPYDEPNDAKVPDGPTDVTVFAAAIVQPGQLRPALPPEDIAEPSPVNDAANLTAGPVAHDPLSQVPRSAQRALIDGHSADVASRVEPTNADHLKNMADAKVPGTPSRQPDVAVVSSPVDMAETVEKVEVAGKTTAPAGLVWSGKSIPVETPNHPVQVPSQTGVKTRPERFQSSTERLWVAQGLMPQVAAALPSDQIVPIKSTQTRIQSGPEQVAPSGDSVPEGLASEPSLTPPLAERKREEPNLRPTAHMQMPAPPEINTDPNALAIKTDVYTEVVQGTDFANSPVSVVRQTLPVGGTLPDPQPLSRILVTHVTGYAVVSAEPLAPTIVAHVKAAPTGHVTLTLAPEELGHLRMTISQDAGDVRVMVSADRPETLDLMRRHADQLTAELRGAGFSGATLQFSQGGSGGFTRSQPQLPFGDEPQASDAEPAAVRLAPAERTMKTNSAGLDLRL